MLNKILAASIVTIVALAPCDLVAQASAPNLSALGAAHPSQALANRAAKSSPSPNPVTISTSRTTRGMSAAAQLTSNISLSCGRAVEYAGGRSPEWCHSIVERYAAAEAIENSDISTTIPLFGRGEPMLDLAAGSRAHSGSTNNNN
jgi:hypothetical protein